MASLGYKVRLVLKVLFLNPTKLCTNKYSKLLVVKLLLLTLNTFLEIRSEKLGLVDHAYNQPLGIRGRRIIVS